MLKPEIAFVIPSRKSVNTINRYCIKNNLEYPVYAASTDNALIIAQELVQNGVKLIISNSVTLEYLQKALDIPTVTLPFSGLEAAKSIKEAFSYSKRVMHIGTHELYRHLQSALQLFDIDPDTLAFHPLDINSSISDQIDTLIDMGYEVFTGGFMTLDYVIERGKIGIEFDVDEQDIAIAIDNAQSFLRSQQAALRSMELDRELMQMSSDAIVVLNEARNVFMLNSSAEHLFKTDNLLAKGLSFETLLARNNMMNMDNFNLLDSESAKGITPLYMNEKDLSVDSDKYASVVYIKTVSEIDEIAYAAKKNMIMRGLIAKHNFDDIIGQSRAIREVKKQASQYAKYDSTILITGETGTGKELFAQSIHNASPRRDHPFVAINCATLPANLIESELFGYVKGAFTGASKEGKPGLFEMANNGTLFLDEISELPISMQSKLLRAIQEGDIIRIGGDKVIHVDTRVICSSNQYIPDLIERKSFKEDLYYRLSVLEIEIPPLRERMEDLEDICNSLLSRFCKRYKKNINSIDSDVINEMKLYNFKGNVRELSNIMERMVILCENSKITIDTLKKSFPKNREGVIKTNNTITLKAQELESIKSAIKECGGNRTMAAKKLGIAPSTLWRKMKELDE
ncbi:MAG: sigma 54-interacting transcriptional regulator [Anaerovoracaceae bacterium]